MILSSVFCVLSLFINILTICLYFFLCCVCASSFVFSWPFIVYLFLLYFLVLIFPCFIYFCILQLFFPVLFIFIQKIICIISFMAYHYVLCGVFCSAKVTCYVWFIFFFFLQLHFVFHICNLIFMTSFKASFSHFSIYRLLSHFSFCIVGHFGFSCIYIFFHSFSYSVYCFPFTFLFSFWFTGCSGVKESKERLFHWFTSNFPNRNSFWQKLHMKPTLRTYQATRMGLPGTGNYDVTKTDQWRFYISRTI